MITTGLNHAAWHEVARLNGELPNYSGKYNPTTRRMEGCVFATWKSILQYLGIEKYKDIEIKPQGSDIDDYADEIKQPKSQVAADGKVVASVISQNRPVAMQYIPVGQTDGHAVAISAVYERFGKYKFKIMDPDYGHSRELRLDDAKGAKCLTPSPCVIQ